MCSNRATRKRGSELSLTVSQCPCLDGSPVEHDAWVAARHGAQTLMCTRVPQCQVQWDGCPRRAQLLAGMAAAAQPRRGPRLRRTWQKQTRMCPWGLLGSGCNPGTEQNVLFPRGLCSGRDLLGEAEPWASLLILSLMRSVPRTGPAPTSLLPSPIIGAKSPPRSLLAWTSL